jgi:hypothetical protein
MAGSTRTVTESCGLTRARREVQQASGALAESLVNLGILGRVIVSRWMRLGTSPVPGWMSLPYGLDQAIP